MVYVLCMLYHVPFINCSRQIFSFRRMLIDLKATLCLLRSVGIVSVVLVWQKKCLDNNLVYVDCRMEDCKSRMWQQKRNLKRATHVVVSFVFFSVSSSYAMTVINNAFNAWKRETNGCIKFRQKTANERAFVKFFKGGGQVLNIVFEKTCLVV